MIKELKVFIYLSRIYVALLIMRTGKRLMPKGYTRDWLDKLDFK